MTRYDPPTDNTIQLQFPQKLVAAGGRAWLKLLMNSWILRTWIIQEAVTCKETRLLCPDYTISINTVFDSLQAAGQLLRSVYKGHTHDWSKAVRSWQGLREFRYGSTAPSLLELIVDFRDRSSTDPRDKIYGLLGIAADSDRYPAPDYHKPVEQVYCDYTEAALKQPPVQGRSLPQVNFFLAEAGLSQQGLQLPSWVPDWSYVEPYDRLKFCYRNVNKGGSELSIDQLKEHNPTPPFRIEERGRHLTLILRGRIADAIDKVGMELKHVDHDQLMAEYDSWIEASRALVAPIEPDPMRPDTPSPATISRFANCMIANPSPDKSTSLAVGCSFPGDALEAYNALIERLRLPSPTVPEPASGDPVWDYVIQVRIVTMGRRICTTANGLMALIPGCAKGGDKIVSLCGVHSPMVLRKRDDGFLLVGDCFFEGCTSGFELNEDDLQLQDVALQ